jgi:thiol-disulfide isomerase/thioredoxin
MGRSRRLAALAAALLIGVSCTSNPGDDMAKSEPPMAVALPRSPTELPKFDFEKFQQLGRALSGTPVVVNIWSSWCVPCRKEAPHFSVAARELEGEVQFVGVNILDEREKAIEFIDEYDWPYPSVFNPSGDIRDGLGFIGQPQTLFYDTAGKLDSTWIGPIPEIELKRRVELLAEQASSDT